MRDNSPYIGMTGTYPSQRVKEHNQSMNTYSKAHKPFEVAWYCAFQDKTKVLKFEKYLKHGSGHAFTRKRLL